MLLLETSFKNSHKAFKILFSVSLYQTLENIPSEISQLHVFKIIFFFNKKYILINSCKICTTENRIYVKKYNQKKKKIEYKNIRFLKYEK